VRTSRAQAPDPRGTGVPGPAVLACAAGFLALLALLLLRNGFLFTTPVYEQGDYAANSILAGQAKNFELLVGNYSRLGFSHPGPAFLYVQGFGELVLRDVLGLVPTPWNGQQLALLVLGSLLVALAVTLVGSWTGHGPRLLLLWAATLAFLAGQGHLLSSAWMPFVYGPPFLLLLAAAASVAAGRVRHLWALALAGGLLVHGHVEFLLFVPVIAGSAVVAAALRERRRTGRSVPGTRRDRLLATAVTAVFLLPIVLNLVLHWPGEFAEYFAYGNGREPHGLAATTGYVLRFWPGSGVLAALAAAALFGAVAALAYAARRRPAPSFLRAGLAIAAVATVVFAGYATRGIDDLDAEYVGYFFSTVPLFLLLLAVGFVPSPTRLPRPDRRAMWVLAALPLVLAVGAAGRSPTLVSPLDHLPGTQAVMDRLAARAAGRPLVVELDDQWPVLTALIVRSGHGGQRLCARDGRWEFMVTSAFVCGPREVEVGCRVRLGNGAAAPDGVVGRLGTVTVSTVSRSGRPC
jgi:hypothetical protein